MDKSTWKWGADVVMGVLLAGLVAPATLALPAPWRGPWMLWTVLALSVGAVTGARLLCARRAKTRQ